MKTMKSISIVICLLFVFFDFALADGCLPGEPCWDAPRRIQPRRVVTPPTIPTPVPMEVETPVVMQEPVRDECAGWTTTLSAGSPVWMFQEESTEVGGGIYLDASSCCMPLNLRVGAEVAHVKFDQPAALASAEKPGSNAELTFVRIPFAVEYMHSLTDDATFYIGGGPDIINTANDISDTSVGLHLSARINQRITDKFGLALEAGYMWGEVENDQGDDVDLDNTFIIPTVTYTF